MTRKKFKEIEALFEAQEILKDIFSTGFIKTKPLSNIYIDTDGMEWMYRNIPNILSSKESKLRYAKTLMIHHKLLKSILTNELKHINNKIKNL